MSTLTTGTTDGPARQHAWVSHLRDAGTTAWSDFQCGTEEPIPALDWFPGAQQLELLRRVNCAGRPSPELVHQLLTADLPMRGPLDLDLIRVETGGVEAGGVEAGGFEPSTLPERELVRVAVGVLARRAIAHGVVEPRRTLSRRVWRVLRRRPVRLVGDPVLVRAFSQVAAPQGVAARRGRVVVVGTALDRMLLHAWWHRVLRRGAPSWERWQHGVLVRDRLPRAVDLARTARAWRERRTEVTVALDPTAVVRAAGSRRLTGPSDPASAVDPAPDPAVAELARRVGAVLSVSVDPAQRTRLLRRRVLPVLTAHAQEGRAHRLDPRAHEWARIQQERLHHTLHRDGYPVSGEVPAFAPPADPPDEPGLRRTHGGSLLRLAVAALLDEETSPGDRTPGGGS